MALVVAGVVEHEHGRFAWRQPGDEVVEEGHERALPFARARLPADLPAGVVDGAKDRDLVVVAPPAAGTFSGCPLRRQTIARVGVNMDFTLVPEVHGDQMEALSSGSLGLSSCLFFGATPGLLWPPPPPPPPPGPADAPDRGVDAVRQSLARARPDAPSPSPRSRRCDAALPLEQRLQVAQGPDRDGQAVRLWPAVERRFHKGAVSLRELGWPAAARPVR